MSQAPREPEHLLESLLSDAEQPGADQPAPAETPPEDDDVDSLIDMLEALVGEGRRVPFGRKLLVDEDRLLDIVDRLRTAIPTEVKEAHRLLDQRDRILAEAQTQARRALEERGMLETLEKERRQILDEAEREAERIRMEADRYARSVLVDLQDRLDKLQTSVRNGIQALQPEGSISGS
jgi:vacuolar-type H+-ATPase subunit H